LSAEAPRPTDRLDKWLWHARFFKTRSLATRIVGAGHVRVNGSKVLKAAHAVGPGDMLTFAQGNRIRVVEVVGIGTRRGPASEAAELFRDHTPEADPVPPAPRYEGKGRPTRKDRRNARLSGPRSLE
jgi:ribosome-associated heat shock protein Hsp15